MAGADLSPLTDEQLLARYRGGELRAMSEILRRYRRPLFSFVLRMGHDRVRAEDLVQETFLKLVTHQESFLGNARLKTWMYKVARNLCLDDKRRSKVRRAASMDQTPPEGTKLHERVAGQGEGTDGPASNRELAHQISSAVATLPVEQREVFVLRQVELLSFREIGEVVGVPENTAKTRMRYALERLQLALAPRAEGAEVVS